MTLDPTHGDWIRVLRVNAMCLDARAFVADSDSFHDFRDAAEAARELAADLDQRDRDRAAFLAEVE